jgi:RimJ/RimL family protein N-acetyltransferase
LIVPSTAQIQLRALRIEDASVFASHANDPEIANNLTNGFPHPYTLEHAKNFIALATSHQPQQIFAITHNDEVIGAIGIHPQHDIHCKNAELGYWLAKPYWGQGIISKVIPQVVHYAFENFDIERVYARPFGSNIASQRVLEKSGFTLEARFSKTIYKNGRWEDELVYAIRK